jgi:hypothetical protein
VYEIRTLKGEIINCDGFHGGSLCYEYAILGQRAFTVVESGDGEVFELDR